VTVPDLGTLEMLPALATGEGTGLGPVVWIARPGVVIPGLEGQQHLYDLLFLVRVCHRYSSAVEGAVAAAERSKSDGHGLRQTGCRRRHCNAGIMLLAGIATATSMLPL
jgi:hypothetical protein